MLLSVQTWFFYKTNSFEKVIEDNPDEAPISLCLRDSESRPPPFRLSVADSTTCCHCRDEEKRLSTESHSTGVTTSKTKKKVCRDFSLLSGPITVEVQQSIAIQILRFCLDHVKQTLEEEEGESEDELLYSMKVDLLVSLIS
ncbi:hypothetical protein RND81_04G006600 [Saponaria officinalis]|uniref:Uncharacterized protein n=1 Tax=Saponaria officinalis TaxID=3572 RepID=A0AAW1LHA8_SAPOF